jgi:PhnB protein
MVVSDAAAAVEFLRTVFHATGDAMSDRPSEMRIGDSVVMVSEAGERETFPAFLYVYVDDADTTCERALAGRAVGLEKPWDTPDCRSAHHRLPLRGYAARGPCHEAGADVVGSC